MADLSRSEESPEAGFGASLSASANVLVAGDPNVGESGGAQVYERSGHVWRLAATLAVPDLGAGANCGLEVAAADEFVAVGCPRSSSEAPHGGAVLLFSRASGWRLLEELRAAPSEDHAYFGAALTIDASAQRLAVGAPTVPPRDPTRSGEAGRVYLYSVSAAGVVAEPPIEPPTMSARMGSAFGAPLATDGNWLAIGAAREGDPFGARGVLYMFGLSPRGEWTLQQSIPSPASGGLSFFPYRLELDAGHLVATTLSLTSPDPVFHWKLDGATWLEQAPVEAPMIPAPRLPGSSLALRDGLLLVGDTDARAPGRAAGLVVRYAWDGTNWAHQDNLVPATALEWSRSPGFGASATLADAEAAFVGAPVAERAAAGGVVRWFDCSADPWCDLGPDRVTPCDGARLVALGHVPGSAEPSFHWSSDCGADLDPSDGSAVVTATVGDSCGARCTVMVSVDAGAASDELVLEFQDDEAPSWEAVPPDQSVPCDAVPERGRAVVRDACDPEPDVVETERVEAGPCPHSYALVRGWVAMDECGNTSSAEQRVTVSDTSPPELLGVPADARVECDAVPPPALVGVSDGCDPNPVLSMAERRTDGPCPGQYTLERTWQAVDACGNASSASQVIDVLDREPPTLAPGPDAHRFLWAPNHGLVSLPASSFMPLIMEGCSEPVAWAFVDCISSEVDDGRGDGHTSGDCEIGPGGQSVAIRAERAGSDGTPREYEVWAVAQDACGNRSEPTPVAWVEVAHDQGHGRR